MQSQRTNINLSDSPIKPEAILLVELHQGQEPVWIGQVDHGLPRFAQIIVRKIFGDNKWGSFIGFKILLRCQPTGFGGDEVEAYLDISIIINPKSCYLSHRVATIEDQLNLAHIAPDKGLGRHFVNQQLHLVELTPANGDLFFCKPPEAPLRTSNSYVRKAYDALMSINEARKVSIFFLRDKKLIPRLNWLVMNKYAPLGQVSRFTFWMYPLPEWMSNKQTQMAAGMADMPNEVFYQSKLVYSKDTYSRTLAYEFRELISRIYPEPGKRASQNIQPVFLNFTDRKLDESFEKGSSRYNTSSLPIILDLIQQILAAEELGRIHIGVVTRYSGKVRAYEESLRVMLAQYPQKWVTVMSLDRLRDRMVMDIVILDVVLAGTTNHSASDIVESTQLRQALTIHRDGLVIIGRLPATLDRSSGSKAEEQGMDTLWNVCKWFSDHNCVINVSSKPSLTTPSPPTLIKVESSLTGGEGQAIASKGPDVKRKAYTQDSGESLLGRSGSQYSHMNTHGRSGRETRPRKVLKVSHMTDEVDRFLESLPPEVQTPPALPTPLGADVSLHSGTALLREKKKFSHAEAINLQTAESVFSSVETASSRRLSKKSAPVPNEPLTSSAQTVTSRAAALTPSALKMMIRATIAETRSSTAHAQPARFNIAHTTPKQPSRTHEQPGKTSLRTLSQPYTQLVKVNRRPPASQEQLAQETQATLKTVLPQQIREQTTSVILQPPPRSQARPAPGPALPVPKAQGQTTRASPRQPSYQLAQEHHNQDTQATLLPSLPQESQAQPALALPDPPLRAQDEAAPASLLLHLRDQAQATQAITRQPSSQRAQEQLTQHTQSTLQSPLPQQIQTQPALASPLPIPRAQGQATQFILQPPRSAQAQPALVPPLPIPRAQEQATQFRLQSPPRAQGQATQFKLQSPSGAQGQPALVLHVPPPPQPAQGQPNRTIRPAYAVRYTAIRAMFDILRPNLDVSCIEHRLLRLLDEAYAQGNERLFEFIYNLLLKMCKL
ncbi:hypothetical protein MMC07_002687 [Pseudocyphellaria aurata]|nr:hypothetical protein [Pseudocyphellaria aurata]